MAVLNEERDLVHILTAINDFNIFKEESQSRLKQIEKFSNYNSSYKGIDNLKTELRPYEETKSAASNLKSKHKDNSESYDYGKHKQEVKSINEIIENEIQNMVNVSKAENINLHDSISESMIELQSENQKFIQLDPDKPNDQDYNNSPHNWES